MKLNKKLCCIRLLILGPIILFTLPLYSSQIKNALKDPKGKAAFYSLKTSDLRDTLLKLSQTEAIKQLVNIYDTIIKQDNLKEITPVKISDPSRDLTSLSLNVFDFYEGFRTNEYDGLIAAINNARIFARKLLKKIATAQEMSREIEQLSLYGKIPENEENKKKEDLLTHLLRSDDLAQKRKDIKLFSEAYAYLIKQTLSLEEQQELESLKQQETLKKQQETLKKNLLKKEKELKKITAKKKELEEAYFEEKSPESKDTVQKQRAAEQEKEKKIAQLEEKKKQIEDRQSAIDRFKETINEIDSSNKQFGGAIVLVEEIKTNLEKYKNELASKKTSEINNITDQHLNLLTILKNISAIKKSCNAKISALRKEKETEENKKKTEALISIFKTSSAIALDIHKILIHPNGELKDNASERSAKGPDEENKPKDISTIIPDTEKLKTQTASLLKQVTEPNIAFQAVVSIINTISTIPGIVKNVDTTVQNIKAASKNVAKTTQSVEQTRAETASFFSNPLYYMWLTIKKRFAGGGTNQ